MILFAPKAGHEPGCHVGGYPRKKGSRDHAARQDDRPQGPQERAEMLLLDRVWLEDYFGDALQLRAWMEGRTFHLELANVRDSEIEGELVIRAAPEIAVKDQASLHVTIRRARSRNILSVSSPGGRRWAGRTRCWQR